MKFVLLLAIAFVLLLVVQSIYAAKATSSAVEAMEPAEAAAQVRSGEALLIDVREPAEWKGGVAAPAYLLPLSDLRGDRTKWAHVLEDAGDKPLLLYCRSGNRSGQAAAILAEEGFQVANIGGFRDWQAAELPTRQPDEPAGNE